MKPAFIWTAFALCLSVALVAMAWSSAIVLRLERAEVTASAQAALEENARLALWRMDSALTLLLAQESARPYFQYSAFYPAGSAYDRMFTDASAAGDLIPSPLLRGIPPRIRLHFQVAGDGHLTSPQVPTGPWRALSLARGHVTADVLSRRTSLLSELQVRKPVTIAAVAPPPLPRPVPTAAYVVTSRLRQSKSTREYEMRQQAFSAANFAPVEKPVVVTSDVAEGALAPMWLGDSLLLARHVRVGEATYLQGCWLDWPLIEQELLTSIRDLLPRARLEPATAPEEAERRLAALPVRLVPGAALPGEADLGSPARLSLIGAWAGFLLAVFSVAALLQGVIALSERRRVFVSAVTHELRTPLTTFRLYTDMLAGDMVASEEKRRQYLSRLQTEAQRLGHLVENVLFYARLEGGRAGGLRQSFDLGALLADVVARLQERASHAGLTLAFEPEADTPLRVRADGAAIEQIVVNLVDNACKYAASSTPPAVHVALRREGGRAHVLVRDHGPGLSPTDRRRLFRPFSKSDREAAASAPGVGLGLALSRRLARAQGGDLRLAETKDGGAAFVLSLPLETTA